MAILTGKVGSIYVIDTSTPFAAQATTEDGATRIYDIDDTDLLPWNPAVPIVLSTGSFDETYYNKGVNWFLGKVKLTATGLGALTISGENVDFKAVGYVSSWTLTMTVDTGETTSIGDAWKGNLALGKSATVSLNRYKLDTEFDLTDGEDTILLKLYETGSEGAGTGYWVQCSRTSFGHAKSINAIDTETISFTVTDEIVTFTEA